MNYQASIHHLTTGRFLMECLVEGHDLREAEGRVIARAALKSRGLPREMDVRRLHQCKGLRTPGVGQDGC